MLALKRTRRHAGVFAALFVVVLLLSGLATGLSGYLGAAATAGARSGLAALTGADGAFRLTASVAADPAQQDGQVRAAVARVLRADGSAVPSAVVRDVVTSTPVPVAVVDAAAGSQPERGVVTALAGLRGSARLTGGEWPSGTGEASIQADAARQLGVTVGDRLTLPGGRSVRITGTWRVRNALDPRWVGSPITTLGRANDGGIGPIDVAPSLLASLPVYRDAQWTVRPDPAGITGGDLTVLASAEDRVAAVLTSKYHFRTFQQSGRLQDAVIPIQRTLQAAAAASIAPLVLVGVMGIVMLVELAVLLGQMRAPENSLLRARGSSRLRAVLTSVAESAVISVVGALAGVGGALLLAGVWPGMPLPPVAVAVVAVPVAAVAIFGFAAWRSSREAIVRATPGRLRSTVGIGATLLLGLVAVVSASQFLQYGSPLAPTSSGGVAIDPLAVSAPALAITAIGALSLVAFPLAAMVFERLAQRLPQLGSLPAQHLARRTRAGITPLLLVSFAVSALVFGTGYSGTWMRSIVETRAAQLGADVRLTPPDRLDGSVTDQLPGQTAAAPAASTDATLGSTGASVVALPTAAIGAVVTAVSPAVDPRWLARRLETTVDRPVLPAGTTGVTLSFTSSPNGFTPLGASVILSDRFGARADIALHRVGGQLSAALPPRSAPWTVHGIDLELPPLAIGDQVAMSLRASGGSVAQPTFDSSWAPVGVITQPGLVALGKARVGFSATTESDGGHVLMQSSPAGNRAAPIVVSRSVAADAGLAQGDRVSLSLLGQDGSVRARVAGIAPIIPGTSDGNGVLIDLGTLQDAVDRAGLSPVSANQWWVSSTSVERAAAVASRRAPLGTVVESQALTASAQVLESARVVVWVASAATALLALFALGTGLLAELAARRDEIQVLRALGLTPRDQVRSRVAEWSGLLALGVAAGLVNGFIVSAVLVPGLARVAVPDALAALPTTFALDPGAGMVALASLLVALVLLLFVLVVRVRRDARAPWVDDALGTEAR